VRRKRMQVLLLLVFVVVISGCGKRRNLDGTGSGTSTLPGNGTTSERPFDVTASGDERVMGGDIPLGESQPDMGRYFDPSEGGGSVAIGSENGGGTGAANGADLSALAQIFSDIQFGFDSTRIDLRAQATLNGIGEYLIANPNVTMMLEGHCDERGAAEYNLVLGEKRALSVREYLIAMGVESRALHTVSFGEEQPLELAHYEAAWARNRRVHFRIGSM